MINLFTLTHSQHRSHIDKHVVQILCYFSPGRPSLNWFRPLASANTISKITQTCSYQLHQLRSIFKFLSGQVAEQLVHTFFTCQLDYCNSILYGVLASHNANTRPRLATQLTTPRHAKLSSFQRVAHSQTQRHAQHIQVMSLDSTLFFSVFCNILQFSFYTSAPFVYYFKLTAQCGLFQLRS